jgi:hypothetical protein
MALRTRALVLAHCCEPSLVQHRRGPGVGGAVLLDQVEARERDIELGPSANSRIMNSTESRPAQSLSALVLRDAVLHVDHVIADAEVAKVGDKGRGLRSLGLGRAATSASSERSLAPKTIRFASES